MSDTILDRSVCCVFSKRICIKLCLYGIIALLNSLTASIAGILITIAIALPKISGDNAPTIWLVGLIMHGVSLLVELLLSTYPARYLYGLEQDEVKGRSDMCCCGKYESYSAKSYFLWIIYFIFIFVLFIFIGVNGKDDIPVVNSATVGILIYSVSFIVVGYWSLIFTPIISLRYEATRSNYDTYSVIHSDKVTRQTVRVIPWKKYFYDEDEIGIDAQTSLSLIFAFSFILSNAGFGVYYNEILIHYLLIGFGLFNLILSLSIEVIILISDNKNNGHINSNTIAIQSWGFILGCILVTSLICFIYALAGFNLDSSYLTTSNSMKIYFIVQGSFPVLILAILLIYGLTILFLGCRRWCLAEIPRECQVARQIVSRATQSENPATSINGDMVNNSSNKSETVLLMSADNDSH